MKLRVLVDNNTYIDRYYMGEPAVSYYIEDSGKKFLFDIGYTDLFIKNAEDMSIDLNDIDGIIVSHGHDDHTRGLKFYFDERRDVKLYAHPYAFKEKVSDGHRICSPILEDELNDKCELVFSKEPINITQNLIFLGEIPRKYEFEADRPIGTTKIDDEFEDDYLYDDSALVYKTDKGIYIVTGCSHSGICNIVEYSKKIAKDERVLGIIGGFHLFEVDDRVMKTIEYLDIQNIDKLYPCHCTSFAVRAEMSKVMDINEVGVGLELEW